MRVLLICAALWAPAAAYIESVAASIDAGSTETRHHETFVPLVAFKCGFRNQHLNRDGEWTSDPNRFATCLSGKLDILKYCRKVYPDLDVTNIVEYAHSVRIAGWCKEEGAPCKWTDTVRPFHCIVGEFRSAALQVPSGCRFGHVNDRAVCEDFTHWQHKTGQLCNDKKAHNVSMSVHSFAILAPCGLDLFSGVEFVCCPPAPQGNATAPRAGSAAKVLETSQKKTEKEEKDTLLLDDKEDDAVDDDDDEYYDDEDDYEDDEEEDDYYDDEEYDEETPAPIDDGVKHVTSAAAASEARQERQDAYFRLTDPDREHDNYRDALARLQQRQRAKVSKVYREWAELDTRYDTMKEKDPKHAEDFKKEMTARFEKTVAALDDEMSAQKAELDAVHQERVQAALNERKRDAQATYRDALADAVGRPQPDMHRVLTTLQTYVRAEEKHRTHALNRYRHLLKVSSSTPSTSSACRRR